VEEATGWVETAGIFTRAKAGKNELRIIVDARNANERDPGWARLGPRMPGVNDIASYLRTKRWAAACDFRNFFYSLPIGPRLQKLFYIPQLRGCVVRLPMGWTRAPDIAAAVTAAVVGDESGVICVDNVMLGGPSPGVVRDSVRRVDRRVRELGVTYSEEFAEPSKLLKFFGVEWDLRRRLRGLPERVATRCARALVGFARSRGSQPVARWRRAVGAAGWVATVASVDPTRRLRLVAGLRAAQHRGDAVPGRWARREARRHADAAKRRVDIDAPAESGSVARSAEGLSRWRHWLVSDAAVPGAVAVVHFSPGGEGRLVYWRATAVGETAVAAELEGVAEAAAFARAGALERPVLVTDSRAVWAMVRRGMARNPRHHDAIARVRSAADEVHVVWVPSEANVADAASRAVSREAAEQSARVAGPLPGGPKRAGAAPYLCFRLRRYGRGSV
jgi:ribonuclease HI